MVKRSVDRAARFGTAGHQRQADFIVQPIANAAERVLDRPRRGIGEQRLVERKQSLVQFVRLGQVTRNAGRL